MNQHVATGRKSHTVYRINEIRQLLAAVGNVCSLQSIHPIHAAAMFNRMRGLEGKYAQHYVNRDVT